MLVEKNKNSVLPENLAIQQLKTIPLRKTHPPPPQPWRTTSTWAIECPASSRPISNHHRQTQWPITPSWTVVPVVRPAPAACSPCPRPACLKSAEKPVTPVPLINHPVHRLLHPLTCCPSAPATETQLSPQIPLTTLRPLVSVQWVGDTWAAVVVVLRITT